MTDHLLEYIKEAVDRIETKLDKHDERLRKTEDWQSNANGKITAFGLVGVFLGSVVTWATDLFKH